MNFPHCPNLQFILARARRQQAFILLFLLALVIGVLLGLNLVTLKELIEKAAEKTTELVLTALAAAVLGSRL